MRLPTAPPHDERHAVREQDVFRFHLDDIEDDEPCCESGHPDEEDRPQKRRGVGQETECGARVSYVGDVEKAVDNGDRLMQRHVRVDVHLRDLVENEDHQHSQDEQQVVSFQQCLLFEKSPSIPPMKTPSSSPPGGRSPSTSSGPRRMGSGGGGILPPHLNPLPRGERKSKEMIFENGTPGGSFVLPFTLSP